MNIQVLGGLASPKFIDDNGKTVVTHQVAKLIEDLKLYLSTPVGTLFGRPDYGTNLQNFLFQPTTEETGHEIREDISRALRVSYPNISFAKVDIKFIPDGINLNISYYVNNESYLIDLSFDILKERSK